MVVQFFVRFLKIQFYCAILARKERYIMRATKMVTRTFVTSKVKVSTLTNGSDKIGYEVVTVFGTIDDTDKFITKLNKSRENKEMKYINVVNVETSEELRAMTEKQFYENSIPYER